MLTTLRNRHLARPLLSPFKFRMSSLASVSNVARPPNWKAAAPAGTQTYAAQSTLPHLPVPELADTVRRLKETLRPHACDAAELAETERKVDALTRGIGPQLQERLVQRKENTEHWLEEWWDDLGYQGYRDSVVVNVSYFYGFTEPPKQLVTSSTSYAAGLTRAAMLFRQKLKKGEVKADETKEGPYCMDTWRWMFDADRIPGTQGLDWSISHAKEGDTGSTGHVIVLRRGRFWKVDTTQGGRILSTKEIKKQLDHIMQNTTHDYPGVGILTASNRDTWARDYAELVSSPANAQILHELHSAAFVLCLDNDSPASSEAFSRALWHGSHASGAPLGLRNRWCDKPIQFIVFDNGRAGIMGEHSVMDGTPSARMCDEVLDDLYGANFDHGSGGAALKPAPLDWEVSSATERAIARADEEARALVESQVLGYRLTPYGKKAIKAFGVSPDSWAQMIVQLAYARLLRATGKVREGGTYEAATTRKFLKGRTEAIRVVSEESDAWVRAMDDAAVRREERLRLFAAATKKHISRAKEAGNGLGVDRHMLGLRQLVKEGEEVPELYADPLFQRAKNWVLSTSAVFSKHFPAYGWGEVVPEGFGVAYMTGFDDRLQYTITSRVEMPNDQFCEEITKAAMDLYELHKEPGAAKL